MAQPGHGGIARLEQRIRANQDYEAARAAFVARQPMERIGCSDEVAAVVV